jgi:carboxypeptidase family protein/TonB-dependent receptor-like protein
MRPQAMLEQSGSPWAKRESGKSTPYLRRAIRWTLSVFGPVLIVWFLAATCAFGQTAQVSGVVTDSSGARVSNANVTVLNKDTGISRTTDSNSDGYYTVPLLRPGSYMITVKATGFATQVRTGITLEVGAQQVLDFTLQVGQVNEKIQVTAEAPAVQLASSAISAVVNSTTVRELPLNGRDWTQLATLQPGVIPVLVESGPNDRGNRGYGSLLSVSGHQPFENNYLVDGISINDYSNGSPGSVLGVNLGVDAIQEFSVLTSNYSAEYGRASGGVINGILKSGTNQFHGDAYYFLRDKVLDARNFFDGANIPPFHRNQFGVSGGGPIKKDKVFIFADYEGIRQNKSDSFSNLVPSAAARAGKLCSTPDGTCTTSTITVDPKVAPYLEFYPLPNAGLVGNGDTGTFNTSGVERLTENYATARGDVKITEKNSLAASWFFDKALVTMPDSLVSVLTENFTERQMASLQATRQFTPMLINTARFGFNRVQAFITAPGSAIRPIAKDPSLGAIPGRFAPELNVPGLVTMDGALGSVTEDIITWNSFQFYNDAFLTRGSHSLKFGFAAERMQDDELSGAGGNGIYSFPSFAGFLLNQPSRVEVQDPTATKTIYVRQTLFGGYLQDDWRWHPNLTLNLGVRYEMATLPTEAHNAFGVMKNLYSGGETIPVEHLWATNQTLRNFAPRVGFSWDPFRDGKTAVRGGFGIFDVLPLPWVYTHQCTGTLPFGQSAAASNLPSGSFPKGALALLGVDPTTVGNRYVEQNPHRNYVLNWNLNVQREITPSLAAMLAYVGSHNVHMPFATDDTNMVLPTLTPAGYLWPFPVGSGTRLNPSVGRERVTIWDSSTRYEGLEAGVTKRMSHGIQAQGSFTWGKCMDADSGGLVGDAYRNSLSSLMFFNRQARHGLCDYNVAHNFSLNYIWQPPAPKFGGAATQHILGGWELGGILSASTGTPFTPLIAGDPLGQNSTDPFAYPDRLPGPGCGNPINPGNVNNYLKLNCFSPPLAPASLAAVCQPASSGQVDAKGNPILVPGTCMNLFGNNGRNRVIGPGLFNVDFSVFKNNYIRRFSENLNVQFRAEFFNIFNHANFLSPIHNDVLFNQDGSPVSGAGAIYTTTTTSRQIQFGLKIIW